MCIFAEIQWRHRTVARDAGPLRGRISQAVRGAESEALPDETTILNFRHLWKGTNSGLVRISPPGVQVIFDQEPDHRQWP